MKVTRERRGVVTVAGRIVAPEFRDCIATERVVLPVRCRTPDEWWLRAAEVDEEDFGTGGPLGLGVDFFTWDAGPAVPLEVRRQIQEDAYEAAREVIVAGLAEYARRTLPVWTALAAGKDEPMEDDT